MASYFELKSRTPELTDCFFAFNIQQYNDGVAQLQGKEIYSGEHICKGLFGTMEGVRNFLNFHNDIKNQIREQCTPQEVYDYEYENHECGYLCDDTEALRIVVYYFSMVHALTIKRRYGFKQAPEHHEN
jgi:hypothetical protein